MKKLSLLLSIYLLLLLNACSEPSLSSGEMIKKKYYTGGQIRSEFIMDDKSGKNGVLKEYRYNGLLASTGRIRNSVNDGMKIMYDNSGRIIRKIPYSNGKIQGILKDLYPNGELMATIPYENGMKNGQAFSYNKDGSVHRSITFKNNKPVN